MDVSVTSKQDVQTGIQRVVRGWVAGLVSERPAKIGLQPIAASRDAAYVNVDRCFGLEFKPSRPAGTPGDLFIGVDLAAHLVYRHSAQLVEWKRNGVPLAFVVHDLLPLRHPEWFNPKTVRHFRRWISVIARYADYLICGSRAVAIDLERWLRDQEGLVSALPGILVIPFGADIASTRPSGNPDGPPDAILRALTGRRFVLVVGTVEPRKAHDEVLAAFEHYWSKGGDTALVLVGRAGWKTGAVQARLTQHSEKGVRLFWSQNTTDYALQQFYRSATGVLVASRAEGYGLPLVEAMAFGRPVLARDLPVFREIAGDTISFFDNNAEGLRRAITEFADGAHDATIYPKLVDWRQSSAQLARTLQLVTNS